MPRLTDLASVVRSKNAGPFLVTLDILFDNDLSYRRVLESGELTSERLAPLYGFSAADVKVAPFDAARAIKITLPRRHSSGSPDDSDVYGAQQQAPLYEIVIPEDA